MVAWGGRVEGLLVDSNDVGFGVNLLVFEGGCGDRDWGV